MLQCRHYKEISFNSQADCGNGNSISFLGCFAGAAVSILQGMGLVNNQKHELVSISFPGCFAGAAISILKGKDCVINQKYSVQKAKGFQR